MWALRGWITYGGVAAAGRGGCQHVFQVHVRLGGMLQLEWIRHRIIRGRERMFPLFQS